MAVQKPIQPQKTEEASSLQFYFSNKINVKAIYKKILKGEKEQSLFEELAKNIVKPDETILRSLNLKETVKSGKNVLFDKKTGSYKSNVYGYVSYDANSIVEVLPVVCIEEKWRAVLILPPQRNAKNEITLEIIQEIISSIPIKLLINYEAITETVKLSIDNNIGGCCVFVEGRAPHHGRVAKIILDYDFTIEAGRETADGKMDFKERNFVQNVDEGLQIAHYDEALPAVDGLDIYGQVLSANFDKDPCYKLGKNVAVASDGARILTTSKGVITAAGGTLSVHNLIEIDKVDLSTGNINVNGTVIIRQNVKPGFKIRSEGDIIVSGNIEDAQIEALGNLIVSGGIMGGATSKIEITGNIYAAFISNVTLTAKGDIIAGQIVNSNASSNGRIIALDKKGAIIGGNINAKNGVYAKTIGSPSGTVTCVTVGRDTETDIEYKKIIDTIKNNRDEVTKIKSLLGSEYFKNPKAFLERVPPNKIEGIKTLLKTVTHLIKETSELEEKKIEMSKEFEKMSKSTVSTTEGFYPEVIIFISSMKKHIDKKLSGGEFYYSKEYATIMERAYATLEQKEYAIPDIKNLG